MNRIAHFIALGAALVALAPASANAQRLAPSAVATTPAARIITLRQVSDSDAAAHSEAPLGALAGAIVGVGFGYRMGADCYETKNPAVCRRQGVIGGAVIGAIIGYGLGHLVDLLDHRSTSGLAHP